MRLLLAIFALTFAAGLLFTLYHIGYVAPQHLSEVFNAQGSPAQQQAEATQVIRNIFVYVSIELVVALLLVITLALYVNNSNKSNVVYVERVKDDQRRSGSESHSQVDVDEYVAEKLAGQVKELVQQYEPGKQANSQVLEKLLTIVCHATDAVAGTCFICNQYSQTVRIAASFALNQHMPTEPFAYGEGFVGQVAQSGKQLYLYPVPENYISIKTGLGNSQPASLLYLPVIQASHTVGVIELALFKQLSEKLLENLQKNIHLSGSLFSDSDAQSKPLNT